MTVLLCAAPLLVVVALIGSGRISVLVAGIATLLTAIAVSVSPWTASPLPFSGLLIAVEKGLWMSWLIAAIILGGLLFRTLVDDHSDTERSAPPQGLDRRRAAFAACFFVGPFAEAVTGFGLGQVATATILARLGFMPAQVAVLGLFSGILVPWGAMATGTLVGAQVSAIPLADLGAHSAILTMPLLVAWLIVFWRLVAGMGLTSGVAMLAEEFAWTAALAVLLVLSNVMLGPEISALASVGVLMSAHHWWSVRPSRREWARTAQRVSPYIVLIIGFSTTRVVPGISEVLGQALAFRPFPELPSWLPLLHPGTWLAGIGCAAVVTARRVGALSPAIASTWRRGRLPIGIIATFLVTARIMGDSGMAGTLAEALREPLGVWAIVATPLLAASLGFLIGSLNATNSLLMKAQISLASDDSQLLWVAALQNTAGGALTMLSPGRVATGCALAGDGRLVGQVYRDAWPLGAVAVIVLTVAAIVLVG